MAGLLKARGRSTVKRHFIIFWTIFTLPNFEQKKLLLVVAHFDPNANQSD